MKSCGACRVEIEGDWVRCPLCAGPVAGTAVPCPLPAVGLRFSRRNVLRALTMTSVLLVLVSFATQLLFPRDFPGIGWARSLWLGVSAMWLVVLMMVRKRANISKSAVYFVALVSLICVYWDYLTGWSAWSLTYAVPILCGSTVIATFITVRVMRIEVGDHVVYSGLTVLFGLTPILFLGLGWVHDPWPSLICGGLSFVNLAYLQISAGVVARHELAKRLHL